MSNFAIKYDAKATRASAAKARSVRAQTKRDDKIINDGFNEMSALRHYEALCAIAVRATDWNETAYKTATEQLFALLAECYAETANIRAASVTVMRNLNKLLKAKRLVFNDGTRLETKVVRVVFGNIGKRAHIYARVLVTAREQSVKPPAFVEWLVGQGGVEAVRKQHKGLSPSQVKAQRVEAAEKALPIVKAKQLTDAPKVDGSDYVLALVEHTSGKQRIVGFCESLSLVKQVLAKLADDAVQQADGIARADLERERRTLQQQIAQMSTASEMAA